MRAMFIGSLMAAAAFAAEPQKIPLSSPNDLTPVQVRAEPATYRGRAAMRVVEPKIS